MAPVDLNLPPEEQEEGRGQANGGGGSGGGGDEPLSPLSSPRQAVESAKDIYARAFGGAQEREARIANAQKRKREAMAAAAAAAAAAVGGG
eukprot:SM011950S25672  [mRNA]  locus=s11950:39:414:- [translate_table: standard]